MRRRALVAFPFLPISTDDAISSPLFQDGLEKNVIFFDPNIDSSSETETTGGGYHIIRAAVAPELLRTLTTP